MAVVNRRLGITIPTYRRPEWLRVTVQSIIRAARPFQVPVFLVDDSTDDTNAEVVAELQRLYPEIYYLRNERNLGIDRNIIKSIQSCDCDYAWPLSEDDFLTDDAVRKVLRLLERAPEQPPFVAVNYTLLNEDYSAVLRERAMSIRKDNLLGGKEFLRRWSWAIGFIGACVINKRLWDQVDPAPYLDTYWAHVGVIMESIRGRKVNMISDPLVLKRMGSPRIFSWSNSTYEVVDGWERLITKLVPVYGASTCREGVRTFNRVYGLDGRFLIYARGEGLYDMNAFRKRVLGRGKGPIYVANGWIIARIPRVLASFLVRTSRTIRIVLQRLRGTATPADLGLRSPDEVLPG